MKWFRFYHDALDDSKVQDLDGETFKRWVNVLCLASQQDVRGSIPADPHLVAFRLRLRLDAASRLLIDLQKRGLLEPHPTISQRLVPHNWEKFQQTSDNSAPRKRKSRALSPEKNRVNVTAPSQSGFALDIDRDRDSSLTEKRAPGAKTPTASPTPAVQEANKLLHKRCDETERDAINAAVPAGDAERQALWVFCLQEWRLRYPNNRGLSGPLDWVATGGPPSSRTNGRPAAPAKSASSRVRQVFEEARNGLDHTTAGGRRWSASGVGNGEAGSGVPPQLPR